MIKSMFEDFLLFISNNIIENEFQFNIQIELIVFNIVYCYKNKQNWRVITPKILHLRISTKRVYSINYNFTRSSGSGFSGSQLQFTGFL